jgi:hemerythrin
MEAHCYPWLDAQKREHADMLGRLETFLAAEEKRGRPRAENAVEYLKSWLFRHTLLENLRYKSFFIEKGV